MAADQTGQERVGSVVMSVASLLIAGMSYLGQPAPGEFVEPDPDWYATFKVIIHCAILAGLLFALVRVPKTTADRPVLRLPLLALVLAGIAAAAYVVGSDLGLV